MATLALDVRVSTPGGGKTYIEGLVPELVRQTDHRILLVRAGEDRLEIPDIETVYAPAPRVAQALWSQTALPRLLRGRSVDLYHALKHPGPLAFGGRQVFTLGAASPFDGRSLYPMPLPEVLYWTVLGRAYLRRVDDVIAVSAFVARSLPPDLAPVGDRLHVIPHGVPAAYLSEPPPRRQDSGPILAVGNVVAVKNFTTLVRAYAALPAALRTAHPLLIAGNASGPEGERVRGIVASHGVREDVFLLGYLTAEELHRQFRQAALFVVSSLQESFSFALLEAMACGLPCLVTECGGTTEVGGPAVAVVQDARDVRGMRDAMERLLRSPEERVRLGAAGRQRALAFSWEEAARRTLAVYRGALARPDRVPA